ncbi:MAG: LysE family translocator, partial [Alphaproteobacteria bacterium]|nr:LysE family translocator [Alphaproteobacteria bacterium]
LASGKLFMAIKWGGIVYLLWLGVRSFLRKPQRGGIQEAHGTAKGGKLFAAGFVLQMGNPGVLVFFVAFLPQFLDAHAPLIPQLAILALASAAIEFAVQFGYALLAEPIRRLGPRFVTWGERTAGVMLVALGLAMAARS